MNDLTPQEVLLAAAGRVHSGWLQGGFACDSFGKTVSPTNPKAVRFDAYGAIRAVGFSDSLVCQQAEIRLRKFLGVFDTTKWNDHPSRTKQDVIEALRGAAEMTDTSNV